jgi:hypothetical protein
VQTRWKSAERIGTAKQVIIRASQMASPRRFSARSTACAKIVEEVWTRGCSEPVTTTRAADVAILAAYASTETARPAPSVATIDVHWTSAVDQSKRIRIPPKIANGGAGL